MSRTYRRYEKSISQCPRCGWYDRRELRDDDWWNCPHRHYHIGCSYDHVTGKWRDGTTPQPIPKAYKRNGEATYRARCKDAMAKGRELPRLRRCYGYDYW